MPVRQRLRALLLAVLCLAVNLALTGDAAESGTQKNIVLTLPAETVLASMQKMLPLDIPSQSHQLKGNITLQSIDRLVIRDNVISMHGVLSGRNLVVLTNLAGQTIQLKVGALQLPVSCDLATRFDPARRQLFVTPRFNDGGQGQEGSASPLFAALGNREYPVDLEALQLINLKVGDRTIPITMEPVLIAAIDNSLIFHLHPRVGGGR